LNVDKIDLGGVEYSFIFYTVSLKILIIMVFKSKILDVSYDILRGINATVWGGAEKAEKVGKIVTTGLTLADTTIGVSDALEDFSCNDVVCGSLDVIGSVSSVVGLVVGNIPSTKHLTVITGSVTVGCRSVRYYCKRYGTFWGCTVAAGQGIKGALSFSVPTST
jgi:hypothetical protein